MCASFPWTILLWFQSCTINSKAIQQPCIPLPLCHEKFNIIAYWGILHIFSSLLFYYALLFVSWSFLFLEILLFIFFGRLKILLLGLVDVMNLALETMLFVVAFVSAQFSCSVNISDSFSYLAASLFASCYKKNKY